MQSQETAQVELQNFCVMWSKRICLRLRVIRWRTDNSLNAGEDDCGASGNVIVHLSRSLSRNQTTICSLITIFHHQIYKYTWQNREFCQSTLDQTGSHNVVWLRKLAWKKKGRGSFDEKVAIVDGIEISSIRWLDNKSVTFLSTFTGCQPQNEI